MADVPLPEGLATAPDLVRKQVQDVLASPGFVNSQRLSGFLRYVVEESLQGRAGNLKEYQIGLDVFGRPHSFDPKSDPVVRVEARQLRFKLSQYYEGPGRDDEIVISVPKGGYSPRFERRPQPAPLPAAGALSTEPPLATEPQPAEPLTRPLPAGHARIQPAWYALVGALGVLGAAGIWSWTLVRPSAPEPPSLVVLPVTNLSGDPANDYLTTGLTDGLIGALAHLKTLRVIAGASAAEVQGNRSDVRKVGRDLNVASVLDGTMGRQNEKVRITVRLLRTSDGSVAWTRTWEGAVAEMYAAQSELAGGVASALRVSAGAPRPVTHDAQAQDYFLRARYEADQLTRASLEQAIAHYQQALARDPYYAAAWYGLAVAKHRLPAYGGDASLLDRPAVEYAYKKAIESDSEFAEPHTGMALLAMQQDWDWARAEQELAAANAIAPTAIAESHYAFLKLIQGKKADMDQHIRRARDLDPLGPAILMNTAEIQVLAGEFDAAREVAARFASQHPDVPAARVLVAHAYLAEGRAEEALAGFRALEGQATGMPLFESMAHARAGRRDQALRLLEPMEENPGHNGLPLYCIAQVYGYLGDEARALFWLERSAAQHESLVANTSVDRAFEQLRGRPAFRAFEQRLRLIPQ